MTGIRKLLVVVGLLALLVVLIGVGLWLWPKQVNAPLRLKRFAANRGIQARSAGEITFQLQGKYGGLNYSNYKDVLMGVLVGQMAGYDWDESKEGLIVYQMVEGRLGAFRVDEVFEEGEHNKPTGIYYPLTPGSELTPEQKTQLKMVLDKALSGEQQIRIRVMVPRNQDLCSEAMELKQISSKCLAVAGLNLGLSDIQTAVESALKANPNSIEMAHLSSLDPAETGSLIVTLGVDE